MYFVRLGGALVAAGSWSGIHRPVLDVKTVQFVQALQMAFTEAYSLGGATFNMYFEM